MKQYEVGKFYNFWVAGLTGNRIDLRDENDDVFSVSAYDFQIDWDWASSEVPVQALSCYVKALDRNERPILIQNREMLLIVLYPQAYKGVSVDVDFVVSQHKLLNDTLYYVVNDAYGLSHMYKPVQNGKYVQPGEQITLTVSDILHKDDNRSCLKLSMPSYSPAPAKTQESTYDDTIVGEFGEETDKIEFKSTLIYPAGATGPDIDRQTDIIVRTLAGFMNANGGVLYIGVNDNGEAVGIENEFALLNSSDTDRNTYQANKDGYENKIRNTVMRLLSAVAQDYLSITFSEHNGHIVCKCKVDSSNSVIWFKNREAYKRTGNRTTHLSAEAIEKLILDKTGIVRTVQAPVKPIEVKTESEVLPDETMTDSGSTITKVAQPAKIAPIGRLKEGHGSFYMNLFTNGDWSWSKDIPTDTDLEFCVPVNNPASKNTLIMVYDDGCVNRVDAYHLHLEKKQDKRYMNGRRNDGAKLLKAFTATDEDMLACFSQQAGHPFSKVHMVSHITPKDLMHLMGNRLVNVSGLPEVVMEDICYVSSAHAQRVSALMKTENQKATSLGVQMDLLRNAKYLQVEQTLRAVSDVI